MKQCTKCGQHFREHKLKTHHCASHKAKCYFCKTVFPGEWQLKKHRLVCTQRKLFCKLVILQRVQRVQKLLLQALREDFTPFEKLVLISYVNKLGCSMEPSLDGKTFKIQCAESSHKVEWTSCLCTQQNPHAEMHICTCSRFTVQCIYRRLRTCVN